jgi:hypothetical protein
MRPVQSSKRRKDHIPRPTNSQHPTPAPNSRRPPPRRPHAGQLVHKNTAASGFPHRKGTKRQDILVPTRQPHSQPALRSPRLLAGHSEFTRRVTSHHIPGIKLTTKKQPTSFALDTYPLPVVWDTPELITSLAEYAYGRQPASDDGAPPPSRPAAGEHEASVLFLRITAKADYFTTNATLMADVPPVDVDLILDPFVGNVLPRSLVPTVGYIAVVAVVSFFVAKLVLSLLQGIVRGDDGVEAKAKKQQ